MKNKAPHKNITAFQNDALSAIRREKENKTLEKLTKLLSQGVNSAWEELYLHMGDALVAFLKHILHCEEDASDIAQEVFIHLWQNHHKIDPDKNIKGYIYTVAKGLSLNYIRDKKRKGGGYVSLTETESVSTVYSGEDFVIADEVDLIFRIALETMPEKRRKVFEMSRFEGLSNEEIAQRLKLSKRTIEVHLYNATKELKEILACLTIFLMF